VSAERALHDALAEAARATRLTERDALLADRDALIAAVVTELTRLYVVREQAIAGRPAAEVLGERLAALPWPELRLLAGYVLGGLYRAAAATRWLAAAHAEVEAGSEVFSEGWEGEA
jgi:hypothetical protein